MTAVMFESCDLPNREMKWPSGHSMDQNIDGRICWGNTWTNPWVFNYTPDGNGAVVGFRMRTNFDSGPNSGNLHATFLSDSGATQHVGIVPVTGGRIRVYRGSTQIAESADGAVPENSWCYVEFKAVIDDAAGEIVVKVDNVEVINESGIDTRNGGTSPNIDRLRLNTWNAVWYFRDVYLCSLAGASFNDFLGPINVEALLPDGVGDNSDWTPNGAATGWQAEDERDPDNDTTYVAANAAGLRDDYSFEDLAVITDNILAVQVASLARSGDLPLDLGPYVRRGSNDDGPMMTPAGSYGPTPPILHIWDQDPIAAAAWTPANVNATRFGVLSG